MSSNKTKQIWVKPEVHTKLNILKFKNKDKSIDQTIQGLLEKIEIDEVINNEQKQNTKTITD